MIAWDLRHVAQPVVLATRLPSVRSQGQGSVPMFAESEVWEVKFDLFTQQEEAARGKSGANGKVPPVMACSEDGVLAVLSGGVWKGPGCTLLTSACDIAPEMSIRLKRSLRDRNAINRNLGAVCGPPVHMSYCSD